MRKIAFAPCIPTRGTKVPAGPDWIHEIKHDGYSDFDALHGGRRNADVRLYVLDI
jgi:hypothetical protein